jgi:hypothetical protein
MSMGIIEEGCIYSIYISTAPHAACTQVYLPPGGEQQGLHREDGLWPSSHQPFDCAAPLRLHVFFRRKSTCCLAFAAVLSLSGWRWRCFRHIYDDTTLYVLGGACITSSFYLHVFDDRGD